MSFSLKAFIARSAARSESPSMKETCAAQTSRGTNEHKRRGRSLLEEESHCSKTCNIGFQDPSVKSRLGLLNLPCTSNSQIVKARIMV